MNSFYLSAKKWIEATGATGLHAKAGRYTPHYRRELFASGQADILRE